MPSNERLNHYSRISDVPLLKLALGINMNPVDIEEGDDVYFECKIDANPTAYKVVWKHNVSCSRRLHSVFARAVAKRKQRDTRWDAVGKGGKIIANVYLET